MQALPEVLPKVRAAVERWNGDVITDPIVVEQMTNNAAQQVRGTLLNMIKHWTLIFDKNLDCTHTNTLTVEIIYEWNVKLFSFIKRW